MISELIDAALAQKQAKNGDREIAGGALFRASEACLPCARPSLFRAFGVKPEVSFDARTLRRFEVGHTTAAWISKQFESLGVLVAEELPLFDAEWRLGGHVDFIVRGGARASGVDGGNPTAAPLIGVELKSVQSRSFWYKAKNGGVVAGDHQLMQAAFYSLLADKTDLLFTERSQDAGGVAGKPVALVPVASWVVLSVSKDDLTMQEDPVRSKNIDAALERIETLNRCYDEDTLPACTCGVAKPGDKPWWFKFCDYYPDPSTPPDKRNPTQCCPDSWMGQVRGLKLVEEAR